MKKQYSILLLLFQILLSAHLQYLLANQSTYQSANYHHEIQIADSLLKFANYNESIELYKKCAGIFLYKKDWKNYVRTQNKISDAYILSDKLRPALAYARIARDASIKHLGKWDPETAYAYDNIGEIYSRCGITEKALEFYKYALWVYKKNGLLKHTYLAETYNNIGKEYDNRWDHVRAMEYHNKAFSIILAICPDDELAVACCENRIGDSYFLANDYKTAMEFHRKSLKTFIEKLGELHPFTGDNYIDIGNNLHFSLQHDSLMYYYNKGIDIFKATLPPDHLSLALGYLMFSLYYERFRALSPLVIEHINKVLFILSSRDTYHYRFFAFTYNLLSNYYCRISTGDIYNKSLIDSSLKYNNLALRALAPGFKDTSRYATPRNYAIVFKRYLPIVLVSKAIALNRQYKYITRSVKDLQACFETMDLLHQINNEVYKNLDEAESKRYLLEEMHYNQYYSQGLAIGLFEGTGDKKYLERAFEYSEKSKNGMLLMAMQNKQSDDNKGIPSALLKKEKKLKNEITDLQNRYWKIRYDEKKKESDTLRMIQNQIFDLTDSYLFVKDEIRKNQLITKNDEPKHGIVSIEQIQKVLDDSTALIAYSVFTYQVTDKRNVIVSYYIDHNSISIDSTAFSYYFKANLEMFTELTTNDDKLISNADNNVNYVRTASYLYKTLLGKYTDKIKGKKLVIIPDNVLCYIPFEALLTKEVKAGSFKSYPYLLRENTITYSHSASYYYFTQITHKKSAKNTLLAFAPGFKNTRFNEDALIKAWLSRGEYLGDLEGAKEEISKVTQIAGGERYSDSLATEKKFKELAENYSIIHIATHGLIDDEYPMNSKLVFYQTKDEPDDGYLNIYEIFNMKLSAEMVVLSACNTGYGEIRKGEGVISMARGFAYAGVPSVVMSLWKVKDRTTSALMEKFYSFLDKGYPKDRALQLAKLSFIKEADGLISQPHFWAGFVQIGDNHPISFHLPWYRTTIFILSSIMITVIMIVLLSIRFLRWNRK